MTIHDFSDHFGPFGGKTWLNCAHQGPLPKPAVIEAREAIEWKITPYEMTTDRFTGIPKRLKAALGRLVGAAPDEMILANSASYGMHLLANGIPWNPGDEVLLVRGDFPSVTLPWLALKARGVSVRQITPRGSALQVEELEREISPSTRVFCTTWVHSFRGHALDLHAFGQQCRSRGVIFVANTSQGLGARALDVATTPVDAVINVGFKWLCGPYGTGFVWMRPDLRESLIYNQAYWLAMQTADDLQHDPADPPPVSDLGARKYDVFGTANFFNFKPWAAAVEFLVALGVERIAKHDQALVSRLIDRLDTTSYQVLSPVRGNTRSTLVVLSHREPSHNETIYRALGTADVFCAYRRGNLRVSPHLHNTARDIDRAVDLLNRGPART